MNVVSPSLRSRHSAPDDSYHDYGQIDAISFIMEAPSVGTYEFFMPFGGHVYELICKTVAGSVVGTIAIDGAPVVGMQSKTMDTTRRTYLSAGNVAFTPGQLISLTIESALSASGLDITIAYRRDTLRPVEELIRQINGGEVSIGINGLDVNGTVTATKFIGDGSELTGLTTSEVTADAIDYAIQRSHHQGFQPISTISGLQAALDNKSDITHTHVFSTLGATYSDIVAALGYAPYDSSNPAGYVTSGAQLDIANTWTAIQSMNIRDMGGQFFNVLAYGVSGDGATDNTASYAAMVARTDIPVDSTLFFPAGTFKGSLDLGSKRLNIMGAGAATILTGANAVDDVIRVNVGGSALFNYRFSNFFMVASVAHTAGAAIHLGRVGKVRMDNITIQNSGSLRFFEGIKLDGVSDSVMSAMRVGGSVSNGMRIQPTTSSELTVELVIDDKCAFTSNGQGSNTYPAGDDGIRLVNTQSGSGTELIQGIHFGAGLSISNNAGNGVHVMANGTGQAGGIRNLHFIGTTLDTNGPTTANLVTTPDLDPNSGDGLLIEGTALVQAIYGERIFTSANKGYGIRINMTGSGVMKDSAFKNSIINQSGKDGVYLQGAYRINLAGSIIRDNSQSGQSAVVSGTPASVSYYGIRVVNGNGHRFNPVYVFNSGNKTNYQNGIFMDTDTGGSAGSNAVNNIEITGYGDTDSSSGTIVTDKLNYNTGLTWTPALAAAKWIRVGPYTLSQTSPMVQFPEGAEIFTSGTSESKYQTLRIRDNSTLESKWIRNNAGIFQIVNDAFNTVLFALSDIGNLTITGTLTANDSVVVPNGKGIFFGGNASPQGKIIMSTGNVLTIRGGSAGTIFRNNADTTSIATLADTGDLSIAGFIDLSAQSTPGTPSTNHIRLFSTSANKFGWIGASGNVRTFDGTLTASRSYTLPDISGTVLLDSSTISGSQISGGTFGAVNGSNLTGLPVQISSLSLATPNVIFGTPVNFSNASGAWTGTLSLNTQSANTFFGNGTGSTAAPTFMSAATAKAALGTGFVMATSPNTTVAGSSTNYLTFGTQSTSTSETNKVFACPLSGTLKNLYLRVSGTQPGDGALTVTLRTGTTVAGMADTAITTSAPASTSAAAGFSDTTHSVSVNAGDLISVKIVNGSASTSMSISSISWMIQ